MNVEIFSAADIDGMPIFSAQVPGTYGHDSALRVAQGMVYGWALAQGSDWVGPRGDRTFGDFVADDTLFTFYIDN